MNNSSLPPSTTPNPDVIFQLEWLLEEAQSGRLQSLAYAGITSAEQAGQSGAVRGQSTNPHYVANYIIAGNGHRMLLNTGLDIVKHMLVGELVAERMMNVLAQRASRGGQGGGGGGGGW